MKKDKTKIILMISLVFIILSIVTIIILILASKGKINNNMTTLTTTLTIEDITTTNTTSTGVINENNPGGGDHGGGASTTTKTTTNVTNTSTIKTQKSTTTETTLPKQYTCPDGYTLNNLQCISTKKATYACPEGTTDYSSEEIPRDTYCVNLNETFDRPEDGCPNNSGEIHILGFMGTPEQYKCLPLHRKAYVCESGYSLNNNLCTKVVPPTIK